MTGYLKDDAATTEAFRGGWFHTGDLAVWDADEVIEIKDRSKDTIISGGENISSIEIERARYQHPSVLEVAVVGQRHEKWGETPCAFVRVKRGDAISEDELLSFCRSKLARYKVPRRVVFGELPKTSTGKIKKSELRERANDMLREPGSAQTPQAGLQAPGKRTIPK
ncbi:MULTISPECIES: AMP-binding enzyme [Rhizobium]